MMKSLFLIFFLLAFSLYLSAQDESAAGDSITPASGGDIVIFLSDFPEQPQRSNFGRITDSKVYQMGKVPVSLFILSGLVYPFEHHIYRVRNYHIPDFHYFYDDYLIFTPGAAVLGLKIAGVEGHSDWGRLLTSGSISAATTLSIVGGMKYIIDKERPDAADNSAFPSGHTAIAFMGATLLHKEYGLTRSPLYSIAGYSVAAVSGLTRKLKNKHWFSDVLFGAGVGFLGVEIGYWATDLIFKDKGIKTPFVKREYVDLKENKPSFIGLNMGYVVSNGVSLTDEIEFKSISGYNIAVEGAWFINPYLGFGGKLSSNTIELAFNKERYFDRNPEDKNYIQNITGDFSAIYSFNAGAYFSYPLTDQFMLGSKLLCGITHATSSDLSFEMYPTMEYPEGRRVNYLRGDNDVSWSLGTGLSATVLLSRNFGVRCFADYFFSRAEITFKEIQNINAVMPVYEKRRPNQSGVHNLVIGLSVNAYFF
jgi:membrane-associated phospholipid phosphatase